MTSADESKMNRTLGIDAAAFKAWQTKQSGAAALSAQEGGAAVGAELSRQAGIDETEFQAWLVAERKAGRGVGMRTMISEESATLSPQPLPR